ncbi:MAG: hypothetical protein ACXWAC_03475 [Usitatibacter sp.]
MKIVVALALVPGIAAALNAGAAEPDVRTLQLRPKAALATSMATHQNAPFVMPLPGGPGLDLLPRHNDHQEGSRSSCSRAGSLCYDPASGHIVFKPARALMPDLPGLQRENISVRRDRIVLRYSFQ